jgi:hypothetical protein
MPTGIAVVLDDFVVTVAGQVVSDQVKSLTINTSAAMNDITTGDSGGWTETRPGLRSWTATMEVVHANGTNEITTLLWTAISTGATVAFTGKADGGATSASNPLFTGTAYCGGLDAIAGAVGDVNASSVTLTGTGALVRTTS